MMEVESVMKGENGTILLSLSSPASALLWDLETSGDSRISATRMEEVMHNISTKFSQHFNISRSLLDTLLHLSVLHGSPNILI